MKKQKHTIHDDISVDDYHHKQAQLFQHEFEEQLHRRLSIEDDFLNELKMIQKMAMKGTLIPQYKQTLEEWQVMYPDRFDHFCKKLSVKHRQKLLHFLHLDHDE
ncbi:MAG: hypothetical protein ACO3K7_06405 [Candidatus Marinamargulisbacteria bacterium]